MTGIFIGGGGAEYGEPQVLRLDLANRHGLIAGATGTGKTITMQVMVEGFSAAGVPVERARFSAALGHAFDYYDGLTFEIRSAALEGDRAVAVGGRYDSLPARLGGAAGSQAVGCMIRPWRAWAGGEA